MVQKCCENLSNDIFWSTAWKKNFVLFLLIWRSIMDTLSWYVIYCAKNVQLQCYFLSVFSPSTGNYGSEKTCIRTLSTQWSLHYVNTQKIIIELQQKEIPQKRNYNASGIFPADGVIILATGTSDYFTGLLQQWFYVLWRAALKYQQNVLYRKQR